MKNSITLHTHTSIPCRLSVAITYQVVIEIGGGQIPSPHVLRQCHISFPSGGAELQKGHWLQLNRLHPQCIAGPKYLQDDGKAEQCRRDLVERSESKSEMRKAEVGEQRVGGSGCRNVGSGRQEEN
jgi:hypothetical protein